MLYRQSAQADPYAEGLSFLYHLNLVIVTGAFRNRMESLHRSWLVWGDEMGTNRNEIVHRRRGRAHRGERAVDRGIMLNRSHFSALAFMTEDEILGHYTCPGAINSERLIYYVQEDLISKLNPFPGPRSVLILDNCSIHHTRAFKSLCEAAGILLLYLPAYSPWLNPIEPVFRSVKAFFARYGCTFVQQGHDVYSLLVMAFANISTNTLRSFIDDAGYFS